MSRIHVYVGLICIGAIAAMPIVPWADLAAMPADSSVAFAVLMILGLISERLTVATSVGQSGGTHSVVFIPLLASVLLFGAAGPVAFIALTGTIGEFLFRKKGLVRGAFNVAQYLLATALAGWLFAWSGGHPLATAGVGNSVEFSLQLIPFVVFALTLMGLNQVFVAQAIALSQGSEFRAVWKKIIGKAGANVFYDFLISPVAIVIALLGVELGYGGLLIAVLPLLAIRHAYLTSFRLQQANRDLLEALVKAIETRDPYTSGHSRRVQVVSARIVEALHLPARRAEEIVQAALLHDIGKIDAVYTEILKKPDALSDDERRVIESHVAKGVELLTSLASFPSGVIESVRHHHEREDGNGYPDKLRSGSIPLGAKIIAIGDAVDAMLSDRPYRAALPVSVVRDELTKFSGIQFDASLVELVTTGSMLEEHAEEVALQRRAAPLVDLVQDSPATSPDQPRRQLLRSVPSTE